jgi:hypothetical protein
MTPVRFPPAFCTRVGIFAHGGVAFSSGHRFGPDAVPTPSWSNSLSPQQSAAPELIAAQKLPNEPTTARSLARPRRARPQCDQAETEHGEPNRKGPGRR